MMTSIVKNLPTEYPAAGIDMSTVTPLRVDRYETHRVTETRPRCQSNFAADSQPSVAEAAIYVRFSSVARNPVSGNRPADRWPPCPG